MKVLLPLLKRSRTISLDFDWFYRRLGLRLYRALWHDRAFDRRLVRPLATGLRRVDGSLARWARPAGAPVKVLQPSWPVGWLTARLALFLLLYYWERGLKFLIESGGHTKKRQLPYLGRQYLYKVCNVYMLLTLGSLSRTRAFLWQRCAAPGKPGDGFFKMLRSRLRHRGSSRLM